MEEAVGFYLDWGYEWLPYNSVVIITVVLILSPFVMSYSLMKSFGFIGKQPVKVEKGIEDDPDFVMDETAAETVTTNTEEEKKEE